MRWAVAVVLATIAMFAWGYIFWGVMTFPYQSVMPVEDVPAAGEALLDHFPENGIYMIPGMELPQEEAEKLYSSGPVAIVHMQANRGRPMFDAGMMYSGFCHMMLTCIFLAMLIGYCGRGLPTRRMRVFFACFLGFVIALYSCLGDAIWWQYAWSWQLKTGLYEWISIALAGGIIGLIAPLRARAADEPLT